MTAATRRALAGLASIALTGGCGDDTPGDAVGPVAVSDAWARPTVPAATTGAVYLVLDAPADDALVGAAVDADVAAGVTLHHTVTESGSTDHEGHGADMITMRGLDELALPADEDVALEPGAAHLMLTDLAEPLVAGATFEITLRFAAAAEVTVVVDVRDDD